MHSLRDKKTCMALAAGAVLPLAMAGVSSAATVNGTCAAPTGLAFKTATVQTGTMSTTFVDVANTQVTFVQGGTGPNCVVVAFTNGEQWAGQLDDCAGGARRQHHLRTQRRHLFLQCR